MGPIGLIAMMQNLPNGIYEVMCHPAKDPTNDVGLVGSTYPEQREWEYETLIDPAVKEFIQTTDSIALINWKDVPAQ